MFSVGLTGNVASGKSEVAARFARWGATVIDADRLVRDVQAPGSPVLAAIAERFGAEILTRDGELDRRRLRAIVLADAHARADLNALVHPAVQARRARLLQDARDRGDLVVVNDIPLLFEVLDPADFDCIVLVDAPAAVRLERLTRLRGLPADAAERLMGTQAPSEGKRARSDIVLDNVGDLEQLEHRARRAWQDIRARAARHECEPGRTLLAVTAHRDDVRVIEGTLARHADAGTAVHVVCATGMPDVPPGVKAVALERPGALAADDHRAVTRLVGLLQALRPHGIVTFGPDGANGDPDHRAVHAWTRRAVESTRSSATLYTILSAPEPTAGIAVDVRPWRPLERVVTDCGMAFDPGPATGPLQGREWFGPPRETAPLAGDLFPRKSAVDRP